MHHYKGLDHQKDVVGVIHLWENPWARLKIRLVSNHLGIVPLDGLEPGVACVDDVCVILVVRSSAFDHDVSGQHLAQVLQVCQFNVSSAVTD